MPKKEAKCPSTEGWVYEALLGQLMVSYADDSVFFFLKKKVFSN